MPNMATEKNTEDQLPVVHRLHPWRSKLNHGHETDNLKTCSNLKVQLRDVAYSSRQFLRKIPTEIWNLS